VDTEAILTAADDLCRTRGQRLTPMRRQVLRILSERSRPCGAYEILEQLNREAQRVAPPTVYRALDFLLSQGLIHKIESQNAFVGCLDFDHRHAGHFFICDSCGRSEEVAAGELQAVIERQAAALGFEVGRSIVEVRGRCSSCGGPSAAS